MLLNYLKIAWRNARRRWFFTVFNTLGLTIGMSCCFLIVLYVWHEYHYDQFHPHRDRLYRIQYHARLNQEVELARIPPPVGPLLTEYFPEIEAAARFYQRAVSVTVPESEVQLEVEQVYFADSTATRLFAFEPVHGQVTDALYHPFSLILTRHTAERLFGTTDVVGRRLKLADRDDFVVAAVVEDWPDQSHIAFDILAPYDNMFDLEPADMRLHIEENLRQNWVASHSYTYVLLKEYQTPQQVNGKFDDFLQRYGHEQFRNQQSFHLIPVTDIHLYSTADAEPRPVANLDYIHLFIAIGIITLLIACINFINLSTVSSVERAKEVGIRKVLGARKSYLIGQFLGESLAYSLVAFVLSMLLVIDFLLYLNQLLGLSITFDPVDQQELTFLFLALFGLAGLLAGGYPAWVASRFHPAETLKGSKANTWRTGGLPLRKLLTVLQFGAAIVFIGCTLCVFQQLHYLRSQPMGFDKEWVLGIPLNSTNMNAVFRGGDPQLRRRMNTFDKLLTDHRHILAVTQGYQLPGFGAVRRKIWNEQVSEEENLFVDILSVDYDYAETFGLELAAGRDFDLSYGTDHLEGYMINEAAVKILGWESAEEAIGKPLVMEYKAGKVVGVLKDYHFQDLREAIQPLALEVRTGAFNYYAIRISAVDVPATLAFIQTQWQQFFPEKVFEYRFLDESLNNLYQNERRLSKIMAYFAGIAICISCFGLMGVAALITQQRFKEIGIRKVLGASVRQILQMLSSDFIRLLGIALLIATPFTWYWARQWLAGFAFRIDFPWWTFLSAGLCVVVLSFATICGQALRAALINPVDSLKDE